MALGYPLKVAMSHMLNLNVYSTLHLNAIELIYRTQVAHSIFRKFDSNLRIEVAASRCFFFSERPRNLLNSLILALSLLDLYGTRNA